MPYRDTPTARADVLWRPSFLRQAEPATDWRRQLPFLHGRGIVLRELRTSDAASLCSMLTTAEVSRFISPPPTAVAGFKRFIAWTQSQRAAGEYICFAVVPDGMDSAVGLFQMRRRGTDWRTAEWGFALGSPFWGSGLFAEGAKLAVTFAFEVLNVHRLEARSAVQNARGNGALRKVGAQHEAVLRRAFEKDGEHLDQNLWSILKEDWLGGKPPKPQIFH